MGFFDKWVHDIGRNTHRTEDMKLDGSRNKTASIPPNSVSVTRFVADKAGVSTIAVYEAVGGQNFMRVAWISKTPNGAPLPGMASWNCPDGVQRGMGVNLQLDIGNVKPAPSGPLAMFAQKYIELEVGGEYWLNIMNDATPQSPAAGFTGYLPSA